MWYIEQGYQVSTVLSRWLRDKICTLPISGFATGLGTMRMERYLFPVFGDHLGSAEFIPGSRSRVFQPSTVLSHLPLLLLFLVKDGKSRRGSTISARVLTTAGARFAGLRAQVVDLGEWETLIPILFFQIQQILISRGSDFRIGKAEFVQVSSLFLGNI